MKRNDLHGTIAPRALSRPRYRGFCEQHAASSPYRHYGEHEFFGDIGEEIVVWLRPIAERLPLAVRAAIRAYESSGKLRDAAIAYAAHGFPVFPLDVHSKKPIPERDKDADGKPIPGTGGVYKATCDPVIIRAWWREHPRALIGLPMGPASGIWCLDVDTSEDHADGVAAWNEIAAQHDPIVTREHRSATGGPHLIFNWDRERPLGCSNGALPDGLSVKGQGGYVAVPPSQRKGRSYTVFHDVDPIDAPEWLTDLILQGRSRSAAVFSGQVTADLDEIADALRFCPNDDEAWEEWTAMGLRIFAATSGEGFALFDEWSAKSIKYDATKTLERWEEITGCPPNRTGVEKIFKIPREHGWVRKAKPTYADDVYSDIEVARAQTRRVIDNFFRYVVDIPENGQLNYFLRYARAVIGPIAHALCCPTGIGKTTTLIKKVGEVKHVVGKLLYTVSTHRLGDVLKDDQFAKEGLTAKVYRGRNAVNPDTLDPTMDAKDLRQERMCRNLEQVELAYEAGLDVSSSCCIRRARKGQPERRCKFYDTCAWQHQLLADPDVWVAAHEMLFHPQKAFGKDLAAVIVDEDFWQDGMRIATRGVLLADMESANSSHPKAKLLEQYRKDLVTALRKQPNVGGVEPQHFSSVDTRTGQTPRATTYVTPEDCTQAISLEYEVAGRVEMHPGMSARELKHVAKCAAALKRARQMHAIWASVRELLEYPEFGASGHIVLDENKDGERLVKYRGVAEVCQQYQVPTFIMSATLPDDAILRAFYPDVERVADIKVDMPPPVHVRQVLRAPVSKKKLIHAGSDLNSKSIRRYILKRWIETGRQKTLVICQQGYEEWLKDSGGAFCKQRYEEASGPATGIFVEHYNNIEGLDPYKDVRLLIVVGRVAAKPEDIEAYVGAITGRQAIKCENAVLKNWYETVTRGLRMADGSGVAVDADWHRDPTGEALRWQISEGGVIQGIGRGRGVNRTADTPLDVDIVADVVVPIAVNEAVNWKAPSEVYEMLAEGIALTSPVDMVKAWPDVWANEKAAYRALKLLNREMSGCSGAREAISTEHSDKSLLE
jgi:Bifunctional DNA primase/polymerase, N-terminal/Primase C terminal 2 (PriCT-2)